MKILQVKEYHRTIAKDKQAKALERWRAKDNGYSYPVKSMFYFLLEDNGYYSSERQNGYIAFNDTKAVFGMTEEIARKRFEK